MATCQMDNSSSCGIRSLSKLKRFLTTLQQFASDIGEEVGSEVRNLILSLVNSSITVEVFHAKLQELTNFPLRPFIIEFLKNNLYLLQYELLYFSLAINKSAISSDTSSKGASCYQDYENKPNECYTENKTDEVNSSKSKRKHVEETWNEPAPTQKLVQDMYQPASSLPFLSNHPYINFFNQSSADYPYRLPMTQPISPNFQYNDRINFSSFYDQQRSNQLMLNLNHSPIASYKKPKLRSRLDEFISEIRETEKKLTDWVKAFEGENWEEIETSVNMCQSLKEINNAVDSMVKTCVRGKQVVERLDVKISSLFPMSNVSNSLETSNVQSDQV